MKYIDRCMFIDKELYILTGGHLYSQRKVDIDSWLFKTEKDRYWTYRPLGLTVLSCVFDSKYGI